MQIQFIGVADRGRISRSERHAEAGGGLEAGGAGEGEGDAEEVLRIGVLASIEVCVEF